MTNLTFHHLTDTTTFQFSAEFLNFRPNNSRSAGNFIFQLKI